MDVKEGNIDYQSFPDGELYTRVKDRVVGENCVILSGLNSDNNFMQVCEMAQFLVEHDARKLIFIIPYFGYSTMERATKEGELVKAKYRADMLSRLPRASYGNRLVMMDLHSEQILHYFHDVTTYMISNRNIVTQAAAAMVGEGKPYVIAATDVGRAKHIEYLARVSGMEPAYVYKRRESGTQTEITGANCDVKDKSVVIYDDMIRSGSSILKAAEIYKNLGANRIFVIATHAPMLDGVRALLRHPNINGVAIMNTVPLTQDLDDHEIYYDKLRLYSVAGNIVDWLSQ